MTTAGDLRDRVHLLARTATQVRGGQNITFPAFVAHEPAKVMPVAALSRFEQERMSAGVTHLVTVRRGPHTAQLSAKDRIEWAGVVFEVLLPPIDDGGRREFLQFQCQEARS